MVGNTTLTRTHNLDLYQVALQGHKDITTEQALKVQLASSFEEATKQTQGASQMQQVQRAL
eukprot:12934913-Prorocentrum_lima.AAC.1